MVVSFATVHAAAGASESGDLRPDSQVAASSHVPARLAVGFDLKRLTYSPEARFTPQIWFPRSAIGGFGLSIHGNKADAGDALQFSAVG
jgi:hypothetical protein